MFEAIGFQLFRPDSPIAVSAAFGSPDNLNTSTFPEAVFRNRETCSTLEEWKIEADFEDKTVRARLQGDPEDMILIIHPLPDGSALYTTITLTADAEIQILQKGNERDKEPITLTARQSVAFEVTKPIRNPRVTREFQIVPAPNSLYK